MVSVRNPRGFVVQIDLPDRDLMPAEVADAADTYLRLQDERAEARAKVRRLETLRQPVIRPEGQINRLWRGRKYNHRHIGRQSR